MSSSKIAWAAAATIVVIALLINGIAVDFAPSPAVRAVSVATGTVRGLDLQINVFVPKNVVRRDESVPVVLTLTNTSERALTGLRLGWVPNGFVLDRPLTFSGTIPAHSAIQLTFRILAGKSRGEFSPAMMAWWRDGAGIQRWRAVALGPLRIHNDWQTRTIWLAHVVQLTVKDLGLPLVLAFLGFWFKKKEDDRAKADREAAEDRSRKDREAAESRAQQDRQAADERAARDRAAAEHRASRQQVFSILLPKSHDDARKYYLPMQGAAEMIPKVYDAYVADRASVSAADELYYQIMMFVRRMRHIQLNIGGFLFLSLAGEEILALSWMGFKRRFDECASKAEIAAVLDLIEDPMLSLASFNHLVKNAAAVSALRTSFLTWVGQQPAKFDEAMIYHLLFRTVLRQELNRVYELWYGRPLGFDIETWRTLLKKLEGLQYFTADLKNYAAAYEQERTAQPATGD